MTTVRISIFAAAASLLAGCASFGVGQTDSFGITGTGCEQSTQTYPEMAGCLKKAADAMYTPRPQYSPQLRLYYVKADQIAERVRTSQISDFDGRAELQAVYVNLRNRTAAQ